MKNAAPAPPISADSLQASSSTSVASPRVDARKIIHIDMDSFYASVEVRDRPELKGKPVAVGGSPEGRGVVATSSYEARKFGVKSAMSVVTALRLCPHLILVRPDFSKYKQESQKVRAILERHSSKIEPLSLDEAYLDVTGSEEFEGSATRIADKIRQEIREETGLTASAGVAPNKFLAKIASDINKPDGIKVIRPQDIDAFMLPLPIEKIWGVGKVTAQKMHRLGFRTCGDLQRATLAELTSAFGSFGPELYNYARGIDNRRVKTERLRKSLSVEETYSQDLPSLQEVLRELPALYDDWNERMVRASVSERIRTIFVKLKYHDFEHTTHERAMTGYPSVADFKLLAAETFAKRTEPVRLIGIGVRLSTPPDQTSDESDEHPAGQLALDLSE